MFIKIGIDLKPCCIKNVIFERARACVGVCVTGSWIVYMKTGCVCASSRIVHHRGGWIQRLGRFRVRTKTEDSAAGDEFTHDIQPEQQAEREREREQAARHYLEN